MSELQKLKGLIEAHSDRYGETKSEAKWERESIEAMQAQLEKAEVEAAGNAQSSDRYLMAMQIISEDAAGANMLAQIMAQSDVDFSTHPSQARSQDRNRVLACAAWCSQASTLYFNHRRAQRRQAMNTSSNGATETEENNAESAE